MAVDLLGQLRLYPLHEDAKPSYGTAGFRSRAELLPSTVFRCGALMALRAGALRQVTGIVITASHNPEQDNGVKLVDPSGNMLDSTWEGMADALCQAKTGHRAMQELTRIKQTWNVTTGGTVMLAHDTRSSANSLCQAASAGVAAVAGTAEAPLLLATPQLHWMVAQRNQGQPYSEADYFDSLLGAFEQLVSTFCSSASAQFWRPAFPPSPGKRQSPDSADFPLLTHLFVPQEVSVDAANGVGASKLAVASKRLNLLGLSIKLLNDGKAGGLNSNCGADYVQKEQACPSGFRSVIPGSRCASIDGDADRLLYFVPHKTRGIELLDGDRIAVLAATLLNRILQGRPAALPDSSFQEGAAGNEQVQMGIVQTAYANGASTAYVHDCLTSCKVVSTPTGVKHLHHAAAAFNIGIYYEANGHGTILFSPDMLAMLRQGQQGSWQQELSLLSKLMNQAVGDALSGLLLVEYALGRLGWGLQDWIDLYQDLPSRQLKVPVPDRSVFTTTHAEMRLLTPNALQGLIDSSVAVVEKGRCFVRPSGTENVVRVYAEAASQTEADKLANTIAQLIPEHCPVASNRSGGAYSGWPESLKRWLT
ncbi:hypothetical protein WJX74_007967 [Apatococcus lobatus]|uniref:Phosphoacetylglucosamine mutase n=1 Tax=Apatococcus lobatus TaxID=904363 RepID=A0AAW1QDA0_9CHLO